MNNLKKSYLVSVIIPTYNGGALKNAIDSIINQTIGFENIELIIVDDASTDNITRNIILNYQSKYPDNIKPIFMEKNSGHAGRPRNIGLEKVTSNYILFSDDDDIYLEEGFKILYDAIKKYDSDMVIGNAYTMVDGENVNNSKKNNNIINVDPLFDQKNFDMLTKNVGVAPWAKIYKKEIFLNNNIKFIETTSFDDIPFYLELLKYLNKVSILHDSFTYVYNIYKTSMVHTYDLKKINEYIESLKYIANLFKDINISINYVLSFGISQLLLIFSNLDNNSKKDAVLKIYKLEEDLKKLINFNFNFERKEVTILNNFIMQKKFKKAIILSNIYRALYNNDFIQKFYKKFR